jgi:O-antigen/teichoic acid export membrane protein
VRPRLGLDWQIAKELLSYGKRASATSIIGFVLTALDQLIVGYLLGSAQLGLYVMALNLASVPALALTEISYRVAFPALAHLHDDAPARRRLLLDISTAVGALAVPIFIVIMICAPPFVRGVLGERWSGAVLTLQILAVYGFQRCVYGPFNALFKAMGRPGTEAAYALLKLALGAPVMVWAAFTYGIVGVAWAQVLTSALLMVPPARTVARLADVPTRDMVSLYLPQVLGIGLALAVIPFLPPLLDGLPVSQALPTSLAIATLTVALYVAIFAAASPRFVALLRVGGHFVWRPRRQSQAQA